ncbi:hypothetical protein SAMN04489724_1898 [Algoriphagus locisalis]|uniref:SprT-like family protein n=2 Tax=Algoriphagus locisalis TaxID=305507 RepID=A0A1I7AEL4_9BACT|nr:hypothetical protein SAMN04489724_1898 [Algoriphagus locisalis]
MIAVNFIITSCVNEENDIPIGEISENTEVVLVKDWFDKNKSKLRLPEQGVNFRTESQELILPFLEKEPDWDKFHHYYFPDGREVFEINLDNAEFYIPSLSQDENTLESGAIQNIMFVKDPVEERFDPLIVRYFPDDVNSNRDFNDLYYLGIDEKWSGWIDLFSYDEHHLIGFRIEQGTKVSSRTLSQESQLGTDSSSAKMVYECTETTTDWYQVTTVGGSSSPPKYLDTTFSKVCEWVNVGGGISSGSGGSGGGGGGPSQYTPPTLPSPNLRIEKHKSFKDNEKLMCILGKLELTQFVKNLAIIGETSVSRNVVLSVGKTIDPKAAAETNDFYGFNNIVITINSTQLNRGSLEIAHTILHEIIHAELYVAIGNKKGTAIDANFEYNFNKYVELYYKEYGDADVHHNYMAEKIVDRMSDVLKLIHPYLGKQEFLNDPEVKKAYPHGLPPDFYKGMAWNGLKWTDKWRYDLPERYSMEKYQSFAANFNETCK